LNRPRSPLDVGEILVASGVGLEQELEIGHGQQSVAHDLEAVDRETLRRDDFRWRLRAHADGWSS